MPNLAAINQLGREEFARVLGPVFEHSPWIAERAWARRPFASFDDLLAALRETVAQSANDEKLGLIRAHPDLVGRAVLTSESESEQASAGLGALTAEEVRQFEQFNARYRERFGFPFIICARLNKKDVILAAFPERLRHARDEEIATALEEIYKIADLRLRDLVS